MPDYKWIDPKDEWRMGKHFIDKPPVCCSHCYYGIYTDKKGICCDSKGNKPVPYWVIERNQRPKWCPLKIEEGEE